MAKIDISQDQNTVRIDENEYHEFYSYSQLPTNHMSDPCNKCSLKRYCVELGADLPCDDESRDDGLCGVFKKTYKGK